jgi:hypothetical protein
MKRLTESEAETERRATSAAAQTMAAMRAKKLSPARRKKIAQNAARARWGDIRQEKT